MNRYDEIKSAYRALYEPRCFFSPPYETADSLKQRLERQYEAVAFSTVKSMACFICRKGAYNQ